MAERYAVFPSDSAKKIVRAVREWQRDGPKLSRQRRRSVSSFNGCVPCKVEKTGGSNGDASTKASYVYTARTMDWNGTSGGVVLGTGLSPVKKREIGLLEVPSGSTTVGLGYWDETGTFRIWDANEEFDTGTCEA